MNQNTATPTDPILIANLVKIEAHLARIAPALESIAKNVAEKKA
jgi:hypothetical protein